jgi:hypothetical protein
MDWMEKLQDRLTDPNNLMPYRLAVAQEGPILGEGRRLYAVSDVLGVEPGDLLVDLKQQHGTDPEAHKQIAAMEKVIAEAARTALHDKG